MTNLLKNYIAIVFIFIVALLFFSCEKDSVINNIIPQPDYSPMWPQAGYDARHTGNINAMKTYIPPVNLGQLDWMLDFGSGAFSDGSEFCIDSEGNIYIMITFQPWGKIYKFSTDGNVIWEIDSVMSENYSAVSLSADEKRIYFTAFKPSTPDNLYCYDSSGVLVWKLDSVSSATKPVIGKDETIYTFLYSGFGAIYPTGKVKWKNPNVQGSIFNSPEYSLDKEGNIYIGGRTIKKIDKDGNLLWEYATPSSQKVLHIVIDGFNNLYFQLLPSDGNFYSLNKDGQLRWAIPSSAYWVSAITKDNHIICDGVLRLNYTIQQEFYFGNISQLIVHKFHTRMILKTYF